MLESEKVVIEAPMSFSGSAKRLWRGSILQKSFALIVIPIVWTMVLIWYCVFGIFLIPYRIIRRSQRKQKQEMVRHKERLEAQPK